jgi:hypothetical protein
MEMTITKPSFWRSDLQIRDESRMLVGKYRYLNAWQTKAEGEIEGRKILFSYKGWDSRYTEMSDPATGVIGTIEPADWWGAKYKLTYGGKEYRWAVSGWGTSFTISDGETEILRVRPGGYLRPGNIVVQSAMPARDALPLALFGIYQLYLMASQSSVGAGGGAS